MTGRKNTHKLINNILELRNVAVKDYRNNYLIKDISCGIKSEVITSIIGPLGAGKSTLLRAINRLHELNGFKIEGSILLNGEDILKMQPIEVRRKIGMVFEQPGIFPTMDIYDNVLAGYILNGITLSKSEKDAIVEEYLSDVGLWDEVKDSLRKRPSFLSNGQQQRVCIARAIALKPEVLLIDNSTSMMSLRCANIIEELLFRVKDKLTILMVPKSLSQTARLSDLTIFMYEGRMVEYNTTKDLLLHPQNPLTEKYITNETE